MALRTRLSIEEFLCGDWPPGAQLIDGEVVVNDPTLKHQEIAKRIIVALELWTRAGSDRGRAGFGGNWTVAPGQVFKPDAWWVPHDRLLDMYAARDDVPPALVVEVRSPGTWRFDLGRKRIVYEQVGVQELWLVDTPASTVLVFRRAGPNGTGFDEDAEFGPGTALVSPLLDGFELPVDELFGD
ncbi:MAG TPA: Uma2 family endonuclease [Acidimicrobiales bacterium]|nr:Uma2 family endonuclease [Acidimicrobiales bacterium]